MDDDDHSASKGCPLPEQGVGRKRSAAAALALREAAELVNPDHNDYTVKSKRARISSSATVSSMDEECLEEGSSSSCQSKSKEDRYRHRRDKNNVASRRSREARKQKFANMESQAVELEKANQSLREKIQELEALTKHMKDTLVQRLAKA